MIKLDVSLLFCYWHSTLNPILTRAEIKQCLYLQEWKIVNCRPWKFVACIHQKCFSLFLLKYFYNRGYLPRQTGSRFPIWSASPPTRSNIMFVVAVWTGYRAPAPLKCLSLGFFYWRQLSICPLSAVLFDWETGLYFFLYNKWFYRKSFHVNLWIAEQLWRCLTSQILYFVSFQRHHRPRACFSKVRDLAFFGLKLHNPLGFSWAKNILKDQLFKTSGLQFDNWLFEPE